MGVKTNWVLQLAGLLVGSHALVNVLTATQIKEIVYWHNLARAEIAQAGLCANMNIMAWDTTIGEVGGQYTQACATSGVLAGHNADRHTMYTAIATPAQEAAIGCTVGGYCLGEDWAAGGGSCTAGLCAQGGNCGGSGQPACDSCGTYSYCTMMSMIYNSWYQGEKSGSDCKSYAAGGGHCTQVTWTDSLYVGCGWANCPGSPYGYYMTCNYGPPGNSASNNHGSCVAGTACSKCPAARPYCTTGAIAGLCTATPPSGGPPTAAPVTSAPTTPPPTPIPTRAPTTPSPITAAPTTSKPTTANPTTPAPKTNSPITAQPTTLAPITIQPTTKTPTIASGAPTPPPTRSPTTPPPTFTPTTVPPTNQPTTRNPSPYPTTLNPTPAPTRPPTLQPTTRVPTLAPTTTTPTQAPTVATCPALNSPPNAAVGSCGVSTPNTVCTFSCNSGYDSSTSGTRVCQSNGQWDSVALVCTPKACPNLPTPTNADPSPSTQTCTGVVEDGYCSFQCRTGYLPSDVQTRTCSNGAWTGSNLVCTQQVCPTLNPPSGAVSAAACSGKTEGQTCSFSCQANFNGAGDATRTCSSGAWTGNDLTCTAPATCPALSSPDGAAVSSCTGSINGQTCTMACLSGFDSNGNEVRTCNVANTVGTWSGSDLVCTPKVCPGLISPPGAVFAQCPQNEGTSNIGDSCTFQCLTGYTANPYTTRTCIDGGPTSQTGIWSDSPLVCTPKVCVTLLVPSGGNGTACANATEGMTCNLGCTAGFTPVGSATRICTDGQWSGLTLQCNMDTLQGHKYTASDWSDCNATCGNGWRNRTVQCLDASNKVVALSVCSDLHPVDAFQPCDDGPCSAYTWRTGAWDTCSTGCGTGLSSRSVDCISTTYGYTAVIEDSYCAPAPKPDTIMLCNVQACTAGTVHWFATTSWSECSKSCGGGQQMRSWACHDAQENTVPDVNCTSNSLSKPASVQNCNTDVCKNLQFVPCPWEDCTTPCMGGGNDLNFMTGQQQRQVFCRDGLTGPIYDNELCIDKGLSQPAELIIGCNANLPCDQGCAKPPCAYWMTSLWSPCMATTPGKTAGTRTRTSHCHGGDGSNVPTSQCPPSLAPALVQNCDITACSGTTIPKLSSAYARTSTFAFVILVLSILAILH